MTDSADSPTFRLAYVPGATPAKWARVWTERYPGVRLALLQVTSTEVSDALRSGTADAGLVRLPVDRTTFSAIPLYTETTVAVVPKDHVFTAAEEITLADLADETVLHPKDDVFDWDQPPGEPAFERPETTADAIDLVAAGIGVLIAPQSLARLHHRRDLTYRTITDAPQSTVALSWPEEATTDLVDDFIGVVRGRTVNSTRGRTKEEPKKTPVKKAPAKKAASAGRKPARKAAPQKPRRRK
ncbi:LysR family substrate-binding domain-containing protein [Streptomyces acidiscabies]|uniref:LysR family substrate-binding domain-containing protein n=1 Tax=Streptomyces acidiscabies TaxID=42234 RepID=A0AAP6BIW2_9ACTN|nr:LysR family substrate-binding domain-containing protein [Streptomyces acidiscabies]MBP5935232.1 LysR family transcriptional regulator [Streptomyces sp. LBUM 1476]MBZ3916939.1 LysR family substrate-binding domain-containing protein [Streptomyces acidiscabies]MDX2965528.1 LysR family substrate-binding domain-containing protein [Streptomyces acidiscabies]MDX3024247.1 LysR family substrate-binding domain-containing protein [Streptomyces acidiscabies]MDX3793054.1 LysR family substrate-binding do